MIPFKIDPWILDNVFCVAFVSGNINASQESTHFHWPCGVAINFLTGTKIGGANFQLMLLCSASASSFQSRHQAPNFFTARQWTEESACTLTLRFIFFSTRSCIGTHFVSAYTIYVSDFFHYYYSTFKIFIIFSTVQSMIQSQKLYLRYAIKRLWSKGISSRAMRIWSATVARGWVRAFVRMCVKQERKGH